MATKTLPSVVDKLFFLLSYLKNYSSGFPRRSQSAGRTGGESAARSGRGGDFRRPGLLLKLQLEAHLDGELAHRRVIQIGESVVSLHPNKTKDILHPVADLREGNVAVEVSENWC